MDPEQSVDSVREAQLLSGLQNEHIVKVIKTKNERKLIPIFSFSFVLVLRKFS